MHELAMMTNSHATTQHIEMAATKMVQMDGEGKMGPNDTSGVAWALGMCYFYFFAFFPN